MTSLPHLHNSRMENLIMAAEMQSNKPLALAMPFYLRDPPQVPTPKNKSELELYKLLERANLIDYFPTFLKYGGDDVVQLAEADEDELLEIVELIGMHHKPLHVRRLQKALAQWRDERLDAMTLESDRRLAMYYDPAAGYANRQAPAVFHRSDASVRSDRTRCSSSLLDESIGGRASTISRSLFPANNSNDNQTTNADTQQQQYYAPHEIIRNAPKRPRLMDSIKPSDLTKGIQMYDSSVHSTPVRPSHLRDGRGPRPATAGNQSSESQPTTPIDKRHPIQISPPDSEESDSDDSSSRIKSRGRAHRKAVRTKSK